MKGIEGMSIRIAIYNILVNRQPGISARYHEVRDGSGRPVKILSWIYLLWLNFAFYVLQFRFLGRTRGMEVYENKRLNCTQSESEEYLQRNPELTVEQYVEKLSRYDIISFDVFDTLVFRPLALPADVFHMIGHEFGIMDFKNIRVKAEWDAREIYNAREGNKEIGLSDIWDNIEENVGISSEQGQETEKALEQKLCYANPFMLEVWKRLRQLDKKVIIVSDMYLPGECIAGILEKAGFAGAEKIYVSNEYHKSKADGRLYGQVLSDFHGAGCRDRRPSIVHVGDNPHSDARMAERAGIKILPYQNTNKNILLYRAFDMSPLIGSGYRAIVSNWLYSGLHAYPMEYEYGFIYGGLFVLGYCAFIHEYCRKNEVDKLLFLSRDGDVLKQAYDYLYPEEHTEYVYWSRKAATKLETAFDKHDYFRRFIYHKTNQGYTLREILHSMELDFLTDQLCDWKYIWQENAGNWSGKQRSGFADLRADDELTDKINDFLRLFIEAKWDQVIRAYREQDVAAKAYFEKVLGNAKKAAAVDIGWAGSGAMVLRHLADKEWMIPCEIVGIIAGTNTIHNAEPEASEIFLQSGQLAAYMYSQSHNRDILKKHDQNKDYNVFWELLLSSPTPQFKGFYRGNKVKDSGEDEPGNERKDRVEAETVNGSGSGRYLKDLDITLVFGKYDANVKGIRQIQQGIMDFVKEYHKRFKDFPYMLQISGRDAYAPMLVAASYNERYLKAIRKKFDLDIHVN